MRAVIEFELDNTEDKINYWMAMNGHHAFRSLRDFDESLRNKIKYPSNNLSEKDIEWLGILRDELRDTLEENKIPFHIWEGM